MAVSFAASNIPAQSINTNELIGRRSLTVKVPTREADRTAACEPACAQIVCANAYQARRRIAAPHEDIAIVTGVQWRTLACITCQV